MHRHLAQSGVLEVVERDAWLDLFAAAPDDCAQKFGNGSQRLSDMGLLASLEVPIMEFNRAMSVGMGAPVATMELDQAWAWLQRNRRPQLGIPGRARCADARSARLAAPPLHDGLGKGLGEI